MYSVKMSPKGIIAVRDMFNMLEPWTVVYVPDYLHEDTGFRNGVTLTDNETENWNALEQVQYGRSDRDALWEN